MSEKKLKQTRLPFQILTSPKTPSASALQSVEKSSPSTPKTPKPISSRKRKPSSEGENLRSTKIGRIAKSKENIAEPETIELDNSGDDDQKNNVSKTLHSVETTPTPVSSTSESVIHIKLPSRRKQDLKATKSSSIDESEDPDDSIVYLDKEELPSKIAKKTKKSAKKSEKKKKDESGEEGIERVKKTLEMNDKVVEVSSEEKVTESDPDEKNIHEKESPKVDEEPMDVDVSPGVSNEISQLIKASGTSSSPVKDIQDMLSDDETSPNDQSLNSSFNQSVDSKGKSLVLTPKAQARRKELEDKRLEKELQKKKEREAKELQRLKEKEQREEAKRREKEEKDELRKKEREEKEKKRLAELEKKEEERRMKEDEKKKLAEQKEEERRQKEDERKKQLEARDEEKKKKEAEKLKVEERKKKTAEAFTKFFVPKRKKATTPLRDDEASKDSTGSTDTNGKSYFMSFQVHDQMRLAPCVRYHLSSNELSKLDTIMAGDTKESTNYLKELRGGNRSPKSSGKTWPQENKVESDNDDVVLVDELQGVGEDIKEDDAHFKMTHRAKFLMFHENRRPAYKGTWRKQSKKISARRPFGQDMKYFDYEVHSDDEWEEEELGESLHGSDSEKEKEANEEEYEVDNDFFVPHGHLSDDEMNQSGEDEIDDNSPEAQKAKLKILQQEFAAEMKKKTEKIKPRLIGCIWMNGDEDEDGGTMIDDLEKKYHCSNVIWRILKAREMWCTGEEIKMEDFEPELPEVEDDQSEKPSAAQQKTPGQQKVRPKIEITEESIKEFVRLIHGNVNNKKYICREYQAYRLKNFHKNSDFQEYSVKSVDEKMMEISDYKTCPDEGALFGKKCWYVKPEVVNQYFGDEQLPIPNQWSYILEKEKRNKASGEVNKKGSREVSPVESTVEKGVEIVSSANDEIPNNLSSQVENKVKETQAIANRPSAINSNKKRVQLLMSVPRGSKVDEDKKNNLISQYLSKNNQMSSIQKEKIETTVNDDEIIEIID